MVTNTYLPSFNCGLKFARSVESLLSLDTVYNNWCFKLNVAKNPAFNLPAGSAALGLVFVQVTILYSPSQYKSAALSATDLRIPKQVYENSSWLLHFKVEARPNDL